ncbi:unnamed protein product [Strongylus vulgaris]|uniref:Uncharacterized protein n=1 Tax=Strongylus vulgaris TaxID=40348 RepID=A0A3P7LPU6_STRVU|nr:unnamed protein product [Strongylus vulgaris]
MKTDKWEALVLEKSNVVVLSTLCLGLYTFAAHTADFLVVGKEVYRGDRTNIKV